MARRGGFADLFSVFTSRDDDDEVEDDPITELIKKREAEKAKQVPDDMPSAGKAQLSETIQAAQAPASDVLRDETLKIEVRGELDPLMKAELRELFEQFKRQKGLVAPVERVTAAAPVPKPDDAPVRSRLGDLIANDDDDDDRGFATASEDEDEADFDADGDDDDDDDDDEPISQRFAKAREFEDELEARRAAILAHQEQRKAERDRTRRNTRKRNKR